MIACLVAYSLLVVYNSVQVKYVGITLSLSFVVLMLLFLPFKQYFETYSKITIEQIVLFILGLGINWGWGFVYINVNTETTYSFYP